MGSPFVLYTEHFSFLILPLDVKNTERSTFQAAVFQFNFVCFCGLV